MKKVDALALILLIIGGINLGLFGIFDFNFIDYILSNLWVNRAVYFLIGVSAIYAIVSWKSFVPSLK